MFAPSLELQNVSVKTKGAALSLRGHKTGGAPFVNATICFCHFNSNHTQINQLIKPLILELFILKGWIMQ